MGQPSTKEPAPIPPQTKSYCRFSLILGVIVLAGIAACFDAAIFGVSTIVPFAIGAAAQLGAYLLASPKVQKPLDITAFAVGGVTCGAILGVLLSGFFPSLQAFFSLDLAGAVAIGALVGLSLSLRFPGIGAACCELMISWP